MKLNWKFLAFAASVVLMAGSVQADPARLSAFGGLGYSAYQDTPQTVNANRNGYTYGAALEAALSDKTGIEAGVQSDHGDLHIPLLVRLWYKNAVTLGLGGYLGPRSSQTLQEMEVGGMAAVGVNFAVNNKTGAFIEGRYLRGFNNYIAAETNSSVIRNDVLALAGIRLDLK